MAASPRPLVVVTIDTKPSLEDLSLDFAIVRCPWGEGDGPTDVASLVERVMEPDPLVVCIGADVPQPLALAVSTELDRSHPGVGVVLLRQPSAELWSAAARAGVRDIVDPHSGGVELAEAFGHAADRAERVRAAAAAGVGAGDEPSATVIVVLSPKGGSGKTMVAANLAIALAQTRTGEVVLLDLDTVFGDVAGVLGLVPEHTVGQLASLPSFDPTTLKVFLTRHDSSGVYVLAGSGLPEEGEAVTDAVASSILSMLARDFTYVVVDTAAGIDERALAAVDHATDLVMLATLDVASIRNLGKEVDALDRLGLVRAQRHFMLNRADARVGLELADVENAVGMPIVAALPSSRLVPLTMNEGRAIVLDEPDSSVSRELVRFARTFTPDTRAGAKRSARGRSLFRRHAS